MVASRTRLIPTDWHRPRRQQRLWPGQLSLPRRPGFRHRRRRNKRRGDRAGGLQTASEEAKHVDEPRHAPAVLEFEASATRRVACARQFVAVHHTRYTKQRDRKPSGLGGHCVIFELRMISQYLYHLRVESVFRRRHSSSTRSRVRASERQSVVREVGGVGDCGGVNRGARGAVCRTETRAAV